MQNETKYVVAGPHGPNHVKKIVKIDSNAKPATQSVLNEVQRQLSELANIKYPCSSVE